VDKFVLIFFIIFYITTVIVDSSGPLWTFDYLRSGLQGLGERMMEKQRYGLSSFFESLKELFECYKCLSLWVSIVVVFVITGGFDLPLAFAMAGIYVLVRMGLQAVTISTGAEE